MKENRYFASNRYQEVGVGTSSPVHLVVMLYDAAICALEDARHCMERKDIEGRTKAVNKCSSIIAELQASLNVREGGDIASSLNRLYDYMTSTLFRAGMEQNPDLVVEVSKLLDTLRSAWKQIEITTASQEYPNSGFQESVPAAGGGRLSSFSISA